MFPRWLSLIVLLLLQIFGAGRGVCQSFKTTHNAESPGLGGGDGTFTETRYDADVARQREDGMAAVMLPYPKDDLSQVPSRRLKLQNHPEEQVDELGRVTTTFYDELGRATRTVFPDATPDNLTDNPYTEREYDALGRVEATFDERRNRTRYVYDPLCGCPGRRAEVYNALNQRTKTLFDLNGNVQSAKDARNHETTSTYDDNNRLTTITHPDLTTTSYGYDAMGRRVTMTDQEGKLTRYRYDGLGRLVEVRQYLDQTLAATDSSFVIPNSSLGVVSTRYGYDEAGYPTSQTDALGRTTLYTTDQRGRRLTRTLPENQTETLSYYDDGQLHTRTDFNGKTTTYHYDLRGRLLEQTADPTHPSLALAHAPARIIYSYDDTGKLLTVSSYGNESGAAHLPGIVSPTTPLLHRITQTYDERGRLVTRETNEGLLTYAHDDASNLTNVLSSTPNGLDLEYTYDAVNRLENVYDHGATTPAQAHTYTYDAVGNLESVTSPNQVSHQYSYNTLNRLTNLQITGPVSPIINSSLLIINSFSYTLKATGHRQKVVEHTGRTVDYTYDKLDRLTDEVKTGSGGVPPPTGSHVSGSVSYQLDKVGNRTARTSTLPGITNQTSTYDDNDRLNGDNYDNNGNTLASNSSLPTHHSSLVSSDTYDFQNRLIQRHYQNGTKIELDYDARGNRVGKRVLTATTGISNRYHVNPYNPTGYVQVVEESSSGFQPLNASLTHTLRRVYAHGKAKTSLPVLFTSSV